MNIWNDTAITHFLYEAAEGDVTLARLLDMALHRAIRGEDCFRPVTSLPADAPEWMRRKWPNGGPYVAFEPDACLAGQVRHIANWIKSALINNEPWLRETD